MTFIKSCAVKVSREGAFNALNSRVLCIRVQNWDICHVLFKRPLSYSFHRTSSHARMKFPDITTYQTKWTKVFDYKPKRNQCFSMWTSCQSKLKTVQLANLDQLEKAVGSHTYPLVRVSNCQMLPVDGSFSLVPNVAEMCWFPLMRANDTQFNFL